MEEKTRKVLEKFKEELKGLLGENLKAIVLYGSGARGDFVPGKSDINLLLVLGQVDFGSLIKIGKMLRRYRAHRFASPVVVDPEYLKRSLDVFPIEFEEMKRHHQVIYGEDFISELEISHSDLRLQLEREIKQNLLWLRELIIEHPSLSRRFVQLLLNASRSLSSQIRALLLLMPGADEQELEPLARLEKLIGSQLPCLRWLVGLRERERAPKKAEVQNILPSLLEELEHLARWVDQLEIELEK